MSIGFIHITKTGGTDLKDKLTDLPKEEKLPIHCDKYHKEDALFYKDINIPCFAIIREPVSRFISAFKYNTKGSNINMRNLHIKTLADFIKIIRKKPSYLNNFENGIQFKKQVEWLNGDNDKTFILKYNDDNNCHNIKNFLKEEFDIDYIYDIQSKKKNVSNECDCNITEDDVEFIKQLYKEDVELYEKFDKLNVPYIKLSQLYSKN
jgi:hypothetical protein